MRTFFKRIHLKSKADIVKVIPVGDIHDGTKANDEKKRKETVEYIGSDPNCFWLGMGDYVNAINYSDKRFDPEDMRDPTKLKDLVADQEKTIIKLFKPIRKQCIGMLGGNHEETVLKKYHRDN